MHDEDVCDVCFDFLHASLLSDPPCADDVGGDGAPENALVEELARARRSGWKVVDEEGSAVAGRNSAAGRRAPAAPPARQQFTLRHLAACKPVVDVLMRRAAVMPKRRWVRGSRHAPSAADRAHPMCAGRSTSRGVRRCS